MMHLIDSHCHLDFEQFDNDRLSILEQCYKIGVQQIIIPGVKSSSWVQQLSICQQSTMLYPALGLHPLFMSEHHSDDLIQLQQAINNNQLIAIGEIGLDFYIQNPDKEAQISLLNAQLSLAKQYHLPVLLHCRKAHDLMLIQLQKTPVIGGIIHAFNGSLQQAENYQNLGFLFGVGGVITQPKATRLRTLFSQIPLSSLALETDAPDMPLFEMKQPYNSPENIPLIAQTLADIRHCSVDEIISVTTANCQRLFPQLNQ